MIAQTWNGHSARVLQKDVVNLMVKKCLDSESVYRYSWLNVEDIYRAAGWLVEYDKPGYNEDYEASFTFKKPEK